MAAVKKFLDYDGLTQLVTKLNEKFAPVQALQFKGTVATISALPTVANVTAGSVYNVTTGGDTTATYKGVWRSKVLVKLAGIYKKEVYEVDTAPGSITIMWQLP